MGRHSQAATILAAAFTISLVMSGTSGGQGPPRPSAKDGALADRLAEMRRMAEAFKAARVDGDTRAPLELAREPLHRWNDPTRTFSDATLWAWRDTGRPAAVMTIEFYPDRWSLELVSLATGRVEAGDGRVLWAPRKAGVEFREISGAPEPAATESERLRQMRDLAKRFAAREFWDVTNRDYALRLLPHPIDRYADQGSGVMDGALFLFVLGTNPESILLLEARRRDDGPPKWSYAAVPLTTAALTLDLDRKDVWTTGNKWGYLSEETYFFLPRPRR